MLVPTLPDIGGSAIVKKRKRESNENDGELEDLISSLPDDILLYLLSFVEIRTAARTSLLSKRWRHVWTCLTHINIEAPAIYSRCLLPSDMVNYCTWINKIVTCNRTVHLDTFRIRAPLDESYGADLENWLNFAFSKKVGNLEVNLTIKTCSIQFCRISSINPAWVVNTTLKCLQLTSVSIDEPLLGWILSNCLNLQRLSLHRCKVGSVSLPFASSESRKLVVSSFTLKHLEFFGTLSASYIKELHISASNLSYFVFFEDKFVNVVYHNVGALVDATFQGLYCGRLFRNVDILSGFSSQLEKLSISWDQVRSASNGLLTFPNVKQLEIVAMSHYVDLFNMISLIEACPLLRTFKLKLILWTECHAMRWPAPNVAQIGALRNHKHLKALEFVGFCGAMCTVDFALCLIRHAPMLKKITLDPRCPRTLGEPQKRYVGEDMEKLGIATRVTKLVAKVFRGVEVVIL